MIITIGEAGLMTLLERQLETMFLGTGAEIEAMRHALPAALERTERCFAGIVNKYYRTESGGVTFDPFHSGQYSIFLYYLSREAWSRGEATLADKLYYLNKALNSCDLFHQIELPEVFFVEHPVGSVVGRATIGNHLVIQQNATVGGSRGKYPVLGDYVWLFANAAILGDCTIGSNVFISAYSLVRDQDVPDNTIDFGVSPDLTFKSRPAEYFYETSPVGIYHE